MPHFLSSSSLMEGLEFHTLMVLSSRVAIAICIKCNANLLEHVSCGSFNLKVSSYKS